jgi:hypothetical protein
MEKNLASLEDMLGTAALAEFDFEDFEPCARYYPPMDCVIFLREDVAYRADRIDEFLTLLWHPSEDVAVGVKIKGFRALFNTLSEVAAAAGRSLPEGAFTPLMSAIEVAMTMRVGSALTDKMEASRLEEHRRVMALYAQAFKLVGGVTFDPRQLQRIS